MDALREASAEFTVLQKLLSVVQNFTLAEEERNIEACGRMTLIGNENL